MCSSYSLATPSPNPLSPLSFYSLPTFFCLLFLFCSIYSYSLFVQRLLYNTLHSPKPLSSLAQSHFYRSMMFTIEQLELIRRLHTTGISSDQILQVFGEINVSQNSGQSNSRVPASVLAPLLVQQLTAPPASPTTSPTVSPTKSENLTVQTVPIAASVKSENLAPSPSLFEHPICSSAPRPIRSSRTPMKEITTLDDPNELEEFMRQGEEACILDMKTFITQYSLRQTTVAMMTGACPSSPFFSQHLISFRGKSAVHLQTSQRQSPRAFSPMPQEHLLLVPKLPSPSRQTRLFPRWSFESSWNEWRRRAGSAASRTLRVPSDPDPYAWELLRPDPVPRSSPSCWDRHRLQPPSSTWQKRSLSDAKGGRQSTSCLKLVCQ